MTGADPETGVEVTVPGAVPTTFLGSVGLFTAMIVGLIIPYVHNIFIKNNITIKMPETVPPMISESFASMIPAICIALFARSERYKALAKIAVPSGLCCISEPLVFGVPLVLNPITMIPMLLAPVVTFLLGYAAMATGLVPYMNGVQVSLGTPILLSGFIAFGDFRGVILQLVLVLASAAVWFPFFKILDGQAVKEETGEVVAE